ncbi:MAG: TolC family protein [Crocinitomicaceae bacterium]
MKTWCLFTFLMLGTNGNWAQTSPILTYEDFLNQVRNYHPLARQAKLQTEKGAAYVLKQKGAFDPNISGNIDQKYFNDSKYYSLLNGALKIPTWLGISVESGYDQNNGYRLNPQNYTPDAGLWYAGITVPLGKGLFMDQRRADLKQAKIYQKSSLADQRQMVNELLFEAAVGYLDWFKSYYKMKIYEEMHLTAQNRFEAIKQSVKYGDRAMIDTLEASIQVQNRYFSYQQAKLENWNDRELIAVFLWNENFIPLELDENTLPFSRTELTTTPFDLSYQSLKDSILQLHPTILNARYKIDYLKVSNRLRKENLKPKLDLKYNALSEPIGGDILSNYSINNYKWGAQLSMPLFLRKERGELKLSELEIQEQEYNLSNKMQLIEYKINVAQNKWSTTHEQTILYTQTVEDYKTLVQSEQQLLFNGESSLFLINSREMSYIEAQLKLLETQTENYKSRIYFQYALGNLN